MIVISFVLEGGERTLEAMRHGRMLLLLQLLVVVRG